MSAMVYSLSTPRQQPLRSPCPCIQVSGSRDCISLHAHDAMVRPLEAVATFCLRCSVFDTEVRSLLAKCASPLNPSVSMSCRSALVAARVLQIKRWSCEGCAGGRMRAVDEIY